MVGLTTSSASSATTPADVAPPLKGTVVYRWGSKGRADGEFDFPAYVAVDPKSGRVIVTDTHNHRVQAFTYDGTFINQWDTGESQGNSDFRWTKPVGVAVNYDGEEGEVFVTEPNEFGVDVCSLDGEIKRGWRDWEDETGQQDYFENPMGIAVKNGEVFVVENEKCRVLVFDIQGNFRRQWGSEDGVIKEEDLDMPTGIAVSNEGEVFVCDANNHRVVVYSVDGTILRQWGTEGSEPGQFLWPHSVALSGDKVVISDQENHRVQVFDMEGTFVTQWGKQGDEPGQFAFPTGVAVGPAGEIYVCEKGNRRVQVFQGFK